MKKIILFTIILLIANIAFNQNVGIVRKNYISTYYDSVLMTDIQVFDSGTIRLGTINPLTGSVTNIGKEYNSGINLNGATVNPYSNHYYIGSGYNFLTFDMNSGDILNNVPITGDLSSSSFQNFRFNLSDSIIYGMVPNNFYSTYFDSTIMQYIQVLDSTQIRFASLNPATGQYTLIGNTSFNNIYTLAGNSIDPFQMVYYYSAVDTLIGIDLYTGTTFSEVPIQVPPNAIFENIAYSCADKTIYALTRRNYISTVYDSLVMGYIEVLDSTTIRLSKIEPNTGLVTIISPSNIGISGNLSSGAFIDPNAMTYFFSNGNEIVGVSLSTGLITSSVLKTYQSGAFAFDMMRGNQNCFGALKIRSNSKTGVSEITNMQLIGSVFPNPAKNEIFIKTNASINKVRIFDLTGKQMLETKEKRIPVSNFPTGIYVAKVFTQNGELFTCKFIKN